jgi:MFS family permease
MASPVPSQEPPILSAKDWSSPSDPDNPRNFSLRRRVISTASYTLLAFVSTFAASLYAAGVDDVRNEFNTSQEVAVLPLAMFNLGMACGPLVGSPLSETAGRKVVILITTPIFALFILGSGFSQSITSLTVCRFFAGAFAAPAVGNASATITDYTAGKHRAVTMGIYYSVPTFGAVLGALVGGFVVQGKGWRWTQWTTIFFIVAFYIPIIFTKETYKKTILQRRAKELNIEGPPTVHRTLLQSIHYFATILLVRPAHMLLTEPVVSLVCIYSGFLFGLMYTFVIASPWVYETTYNFSLTGQSLSFLGLIIGTMFGPLPLILIDLKVYQPRLAAFVSAHSEHDRFPPEHRLYPAMYASPFLPTFLLLFGWTARPSIHYTVPILFQGLAMLSSVVIYASANLFMMETYGPLFGASAAGAAMLSRYTLSAAFPLFSLKMYEGLGTGWATTVLAACTVLMAPIPWLFWTRGERLRNSGKYETSA